ncbi:GNAT family N-acetyltransferase [Mumia sp. ZJ430]|uniref:GNAT family N-acetyltransferase n=1 Tax=Mumia sp. ZJ430 TaxID=2708083 RepID=UPI001AB04EB2|nr:GNAT family N-acetyltransferase [Mumia sp. ZJ430]
MAPLVRERRPEDVPTLVAVLAEVHEHDRYPIVGTHVEPGWLTEPDGPAWVAEVDDEVVGQAALTTGADAVSRTALGGPGVDAVTLSRFFVAPRSRGTGAAAALLDTVETYAGGRSLGLALEVVAHNEAARRLYERRGWSPLGSYEVRWFGADGPAYEAYRFVLPVRAANF